MPEVPETTPEKLADTTSEFDRDTAVTPAGGGVYDADLAPGWVIGGGVNGGYLLAVVGRAIGAHLPAKPDPVSMSAYYASASVPGPAQVRVEVKRDGGSLAIAAAELWQDGDLRLTVLAQYGEFARIGATAWGRPHVTGVEPELPDRERCVPTSWAPPQFRGASPMLDRFEMLIHPEQVGWAVGEPSHRGVVSAWVRHHDREPDLLGLLQAVDALPPTTFDLGMPGWAPTLELTCHLRARPAPGWLKVRHQTHYLTDGLFEEDGEVWDATGRLVAQSRQLARQPRQQ